MRGRASSLLVGRGLDVAERGDEITKNFRRHHDRITVTADILCDLHDHAAGVTLEVEKEHLAVGQDFFGMQ